MMLVLLSLLKNRTTRGSGGPPALGCSNALPAIGGTT